MLDINEATKIIKSNLPGEKINSYVEYKNLYLFQVFMQKPFEENMDPFFSVNRDTGEFRDFSIITDGNITEIVSLFKKANRL
jgi:hypothetical protein